MGRVHRLTALACVSISTVGSAADPTREDALQALDQAITFFHESVASHGGYVWIYSPDLTHRRGEAVVGLSTIWVQPPGTPTVGEVYLAAFEVAGEPRYLDAARDAAQALMAGQMRSGGWSYSIEFDPDKRKAFGYRAIPPYAKQRARSTLDDDTTTAALRFLMKLDRTLEFREEAIHEAVEFALNGLFSAQYPNGGWPQWWEHDPEGKPTEDEFPILSASYPADWSRIWLNDWPGRYFTNDHVTANVVETLLLAHEIYEDARALEAAEKTGGFLIRAQMPDPQPAWSQQYDRMMHPCWDRKFEPPAISGGESQGILDALLLLYRKTGHNRFLEPVPRALAYLNASRLDEHTLARFYELRTNRPLFFTKDYRLTYESDNLPTHYAFLVPSRLERIENEYARILAASPEERDPRPVSPKRTKELSSTVAAIIHAQDERGAWVEPSGNRIESRRFVANVTTLCRFLEAEARAAADDR